MKEYDRVRLVTHKEKFLKYGYDIGAQAVIIEPKKGDYWLIQFIGEWEQDEDGVWYYTGEVLDALDEDLEVIPAKKKHNYENI